MRRLKSPEALRSSHISSRTRRDRRNEYLKKGSRGAITMDLKSKIRRIPEFKGVVFWDITPLLKDRHAFRECIKGIADHFRAKDIDIVVSNEARGFIIGAAVAHELGVGFVPIRKMGKLPPKVASLSYKKE